MGEMEIGVGSLAHFTRLGFVYGLKVMGKPN